MIEYKIFQYKHLSKFLTLRKKTKINPQQQFKSSQTRGKTVDLATLLHTVSIFHGHIVLMMKFMLRALWQTLLLKVTFIILLIPHGNHLIYSICVSVPSTWCG